eukprot:401566_1
MATTDTKDQLAAHTELSPMNKTDAKVPEDKPPKEELEEDRNNDIEQEEMDLMKQISYDPTDDPMHVDFNEDQWLPCIPGLSLTMATIIFAIIGAGVGITIALVNPTATKISISIPTNTTVTDAPYDDDFDYSKVVIKDITEMSGTAYIDYVVEGTKTTIVNDEIITISDDWSKIIGFPGKLWVNALKLLVLPLIILMMVILPSRVDEIGYIAKR